MMNGSDISLRALEPEDIDVLYLWENDPSVWGVSGTLAPFSRQVLRQFIEKQQLDIWSAGQLRFVIVCNNDGRAVGTIDLFDADPFNMRAGVGILINGLERGRGYASQALELLIDYARNILLLNQLYCDIDISNEAKPGTVRRVRIRRMRHPKALETYRRGLERRGHNAAAIAIACPDLQHSPPPSRCQGFLRLSILIRQTGFTGRHDLSSGIYSLPAVSIS